MKKLLGLLALLFSFNAFAFKVPASPGPGLSMTLGNWTTASNFTGTFNAAGATAATLTANVAGTAVSMVGTASLASTAASVAVAAWRATPTGLVGSLALSWLLEYGLEYGSSGWTHTTAGLCYDCTGVCFGTAQEAADAFQAQTGWPHITAGAVEGSKVTMTVDAWGTVFKCDVRTTTPKKVAATDADWALPAAATLPPAVATEQAQKGVALPLTPPKFDPAYKDIAIGEPYIDPVTGKRYQDYIRVTPSADGKSFDVQTFKQEVNPDGTPATTSGGSAATPEGTSKTDCDKFPNSVGCSDWGEPEEVDLGKDTKNVSITPDSGWMTNGTCPADKSYTIHGGQTLTFKYQPICDAAGWLRPVVIGLGWLTAVLTFMGISRRVQG